MRVHALKRNPNSDNVAQLAPIIEASPSLTRWKQGMFAARTRSPERPEHAGRQSLEPLGASTKLLLPVKVAHTPLLQNTLSLTALQYHVYISALLQPSN